MLWIRWKIFTGTYERPIDSFKEKEKIAVFVLQLIFLILGDTSQAGFGAT
jgi:hypothetical protein